MGEHIKLRDLKGIGEKTEASFKKLNIRTVADLIRFYPRTYEIYEPSKLISMLNEGETATITGTIYGKVQVVQTKNMSIVSIHVKDISGVLKATWFRMPFLKNTLGKGGVVTLRGRVVERRGTLCMEQPEVFFPSATYQAKENTMQPVYPLTAGLSNNTIIKTMKQALENLDVRKDILPKYLLLEHQLEESAFAIKNIHFPKDMDSFLKARERIVFEEFLIFILALRRLKEANDIQENTFSLWNDIFVGKLLNCLPYELTNAQKRTWEEIKNDMQSHKVMSRLIQGDVGSGKTIVALLALVMAAENGYQGAMMAPTEVLAKQHYLSIREMFQKYELPFQVILLTGSMSAKEKKEAYDLIESGNAHIIVGTHALIEEKVHYQNLALVVTDEQHRFGVKQRERLAAKGSYPHILVMSATPIPRTLAMIVYGDLDISVMDELPANRIPIKNCVVDTGYRSTAYKFMKKQITLGKQCYVICPMVEESENLDAENVLDYSKTLQAELGNDIKVAFLHGRMKQTEKDTIMEAFARNEIHVLVSTTVIEVGINVPNATVMMIENAERFGLAQLHQLRGRVGRGSDQSYCIFMSGSKTDVAMERLSILNKSNDGFFIASEDLKMRGPGDLFGIRQSGILEFRIADVFQDAGILQEASEAASKLMQQDPDLKNDEHKELSDYLEVYLRNGMVQTTL